MYCLPSCFLWFISSMFFLSFLLSLALLSILKINFIFSASYILKHLFINCYRVYSIPFEKFASVFKCVTSCGEIIHNSMTLLPNPCSIVGIHLTITQ